MEKPKQAQLKICLPKTDEDREFEEMEGFSLNVGPLMKSKSGCSVNSLTGDYDDWQMRQILEQTGMSDSDDLERA